MQGRVTQFRFRDTYRNRLAARIATAVRRDEFRRGQTRWRRLSFAIGVLYLFHLFSSTTNEAIQAIAVMGVLLFGCCIVTPRLGRLKTVDSETDVLPHATPERIS